MSVSVRRFVVLLVLTLLASGCGKGGGKWTDEKSHLSAAGRLYGKYIQRNRGQRPPTLDALKQFAGKLKEDELPGITPSEVNDVFISPRDDQPLVLRKLTKQAGMGSGENEGKGPVVLHEAEGSGGKRWVVFENTDVKEVDEDEFKKLVPEAN